MAEERVFLSPPWMTGEEMKLVQEAFASNYIAPCGPMVDRFESAFAELTGAAAACALSSATAGIDLLADILGIGAGDAVVCSDLTFIASAGPFSHRGARLVFIDSDPATWNLDPALVEETFAGMLRRGEPLPKALVAVDLYGQCADYDALETCCSKYRVPLIVDAAESLGARYRGRPSGSAGIAAVSSFNGNKIITSSGGGMLFSGNSEIVNTARRLSQQSREPFPWYEHVRVGYNYRMSNIVAAIGLGQLGRLDEIIARKRRVFGWYRERLEGRGGISFMPEAGYGECTRWLTVALLESAVTDSGDVPSPRVRKVLDALDRADIEARPVWKPMHLQPVFRDCRLVGAGGTPVTERLFAGGICLPSGCGLTEDQVDRISGIVKESI
ncbi:MAG: DegT/DnrJ/EryC1/StrS family aminotransferase [Kiritimatiellae bacterium]|nr:DegT/DnrJ/EryC1/StrS family aminotransferase [Kiritimatiellia bacterium]